MQSLYSSFRARLIAALRWSERYTKTDMVYLASGSFWMIASQVATGAIAFGLAIAFANLIPREAYGNYRYILSVAGVLGAFSLSGLGLFVGRSVSAGEEGALRHAFTLSFLWALPVSAVACVGAGYYFLASNATLAWSLVIIALATPPLNSAQLYSTYLSGKRDFRRASLFNFLISAFQAVALLIALIYRLDVLGLVLTYFAANTIATVACYAATLWIYNPSGTFNAALARFSTKLSFANIAAGLVSQLDKVLLFHFVGAAPVAVYALAQAPIVQMRGALKLSTPLSLPKLAAAERATVATHLEDRLQRFTLGILMMVAVYIALAPEFFKLFFPAYLDAVPYSQGLALMLLLFPKKLVSLALYAQQEKRGQYTLTLATPVTQIILLIVLVPFIGIWGAVIAQLGANLVTSVLANHYFAKFKNAS